MSWHRYSVGRNASLLLNFPIMPNGLIHTYDHNAVLQFADEIKNAFAINLTKGSKATALTVREGNKQFSTDKVTDSNKDSYWTIYDSIRECLLTLDFGKPRTFN